MFKRHGIPTAVNVDGLEWQRGKWNRLGKEVFRRGAHLTAATADVIIADSLEIGRVWQEGLGRSSTFIPYGGDIVDGLGSRRIESLGIKPDSYVLVVARLVPENSIELFLDAVDRLPATLPVVLVGSTAKDSPVTARLAQLQKDRANFSWLGHVDDQELLAELWAHCTLYFHGHTVGGTNPALLQALGYGAPTLALDTPFSVEVLRSPAQVVAADAEAVANSILAIVDDPQRQQDFREHGRAVVGERYSWDVVLAAYHDVLSELSAAERPATAPTHRSE